MRLAHTGRTEEHERADRLVGVLEAYTRRVDFKNTIIIMTSNIGSRQLKDFGSGVGFATKPVDKEYTHGKVARDTCCKACALTGNVRNSE